MKRAHRLRRPAQFQRVRRIGRVVQHPLVRLTLAPNRRRQTRCGIVASKQIGKAVQRNRARRRVREALRLDLAQVQPGYDLVVVLRSPVLLSIPFTELQAALRQVLREAGIWRETPPLHAVQATSAIGRQAPSERNETPT